MADKRDNLSICRLGKQTKVRNLTLPINASILVRLAICGSRIVKLINWSILAGGMLALSACTNNTPAPAPLLTTPLASESTASSQPPKVETKPTPTPTPTATPTTQQTNVQAIVPITRPGPVIAHLGPTPITMDQLIGPLLDGYGLNVLLNVAQLEYVKQQTAKAGITVTAEDIQRERDSTLADRFADADKADREALFKDYIQKTHYSMAEFELVFETNAHLRKLAEPLTIGKINDEVLHEAFRQLYGETVSIRHIQVSTLPDIQEAQRRLAAGEPFEKVAHDLSTNVETAAMGGELPPFSRQATGYPQNFKDVAFALKEGQVSEVVQAAGTYHLIKLEKRFEPKAVNFDDVKESIRQDLQERLVQATIKSLREQYAQDVVQAMTIDNPTLKAQLDARLHQRDQQITDQNDIKARFEKQKQEIMNRSATMPSTMPAAPGVARPPATRE